jgi:hypothetical protein
MPEPDESADRITLLALPVALAGALLLVLLPPTRFLIDASIGMEMHELGHASVLWLGSRMAIPIPMLTFVPSEDRSVLMFLLMAGGLALAARQSWLEKCRGAAAAAAFLLALLFVMTALPDHRHRVLVDFGGIGGEFWLATLLVLAWFHPLPEAVRWPRWRHVFLVIGACVLVRNAHRWLIMGEIPWGGFWGEEGDMDALMDVHGWSPRDIQRAYGRVGVLCLAALAVQWAIAALPAGQRMLARRQA